MTTIACDGKEMAGDGRSTNAADMICSGDFVKVERLSSGAVFGFSGMAKDHVTVREWLELKPDNRPKLEVVENFSAMVMDADGIWFVEGPGGSMFRAGIPFAIGSGARFAIGGMRGKLSPKEAVEMAAEYDPWTGGKITNIALREGRK